MTDYKRKFEECSARFDDVFNLTTAASKIIDSNLTILRVNNALTDLLGYSSQELIGTQILDYACAQHQHHWHDLQNAMWKEGRQNFKLDACIVKKDGSLAWVHVTTVSFKADNISYAYSILDDFTDWKKLQQSEQRLAMALKYSNMTVWELDLDERSITWTEGFDQLFGHIGADAGWKEEKLLQMFLPEDRIKLQDLLIAIKPGQNLDFQGRIQTADGIVKWINLHGRAENSDDGRGKVIGTLYDITKEKLAEREKDDFITIASHELKTPLTTLKASLQLLERTEEPPTARSNTLLQQASKSMNKVTVLVDELLNASLMTEGQLHLKKTRFNLSKVIDECCLHITAAGAFNIVTEGVKDAEVEADSERIQRVIINFVNNAAKYAPQSKDIVIRVDQEQAHTKVSVTDKGPGISREMLPHLFDRFYRASENNTQYSGLGLGLYISAEIIKKHGGEIGVDSEEGAGSSFWFTLPSAL